MRMHGTPIPTRRRISAVGAAVLALGLAWAGALPAEAQQKPLTLRLASGAAADQALAKAWVKFAELVKEKSKGRLIVETYLASSLFEERTAVEAVLNGTLGIASASNQNYGAFTDAFLFMDMPYAIESAEGLRKVLDGPIGQEIREKVEKKPGLKILMTPDNGGFRPLYNTRREIRVPADMKGLKFRITASPVEAALFRAWGASATPMGAPETFTGIQTGTIDGHAFNWTWAYKLKHFDILKFATDVNYAVNTSVATMRLEAFNKLPKDLQEVLLAAGKEAEGFSITTDAAEVDEARQGALKAGIKIYTPTPAEMDQWRSAAQAVYTQFRDRVSPEYIAKVKQAQR